MQCFNKQHFATITLVFICHVVVIYYVYADVVRIFRTFPKCSYLTAQINLLPLSCLLQSRWSTTNNNLNYFTLSFIIYSFQVCQTVTNSKYFVHFAFIFSTIFSFRGHAPSIIKITLSLFDYNTFVWRVQRYTVTEFIVVMDNPSISEGFHSLLLWDTYHGIMSSTNPNFLNKKE